jgi:hypothetical protein
MTVSVTRLPDDIGIGAQVTFMPDVAKNTSESGNSGRKLMRPPLRNYMVSLSQEISDEMQAIVMATRVSRYPLSFRDPTAYTLLDDEAIVAADGLSAKIGKNWEPATGPHSFFDRIVIIDESEENLSITINDITPAGGTWSLGDYGILQFSPAISPSDAVRVTGQYLKPVCILDPPSAVAQGKIVNGALIYQFSSMRLEEIFEKEFIALTGADSP